MRAKSLKVKETLINNMFVIPHKFLPFRHVFVIPNMFVIPTEAEES